MDRNTIIAIVLIGVILITFSIINQPPPPEEGEELDDEVREQVEEDVPPEEEDVERPDPADDPVRETPDREVAPAPGTLDEEVDYAAPFDELAQGEKEQIIVENEKFKLTFSNKGGRIEKVELKDFKNHKDENVVLFDEESSTKGYKFHHEEDIINTDNLYFDIAGSAGTVEEGERKTIKMVLDVDEEVSLEKTYIIHGDRYLVEHDARWRNFDQIIPNNINFIDLDWQSRIKQQESALDEERRNTTVFFKYLDNTPSNLDYYYEDEESFTARTKWISFRQKFFSHTLLARDNFYRGKVSKDHPEATDHVKDLKAEIVLPYEQEQDRSYGIDLYLGPNQYRELNAAGPYLERQVYLGWFVFRWVNEYIILPIFNFFGSFTSNYGLVIFFLTLAIKVITLPLTYKSYLSMAKMRALKPDIDALKEKYEGDMQKMQQEQMKLYQKAGVNPISGCVPMLLQLPILIALFHFFPYSIELRNASFLWATDLSSYDVFWEFPGNFSIPFYGEHVSLFALLMAASTLIFTLMNNAMSGAQKEMQYVAIIIPFVLLFVFNSFAAGLTYYYFLFNVMSIGHHLAFKFVVDEDDLKNRIEENKKKPAQKSKFQKKLEDLQKKQEEVQKQREAQKSKKKAKKRK